MKNEQPQYQSNWLFRFEEASSLLPFKSQQGSVTERRHSDFYFLCQASKQNRSFKKIADLISCEACQLFSVSLHEALLPFL